jgi:hypothetical protein
VKPSAKLLRSHGYIAICKKKTKYSLNQGCLIGQKTRLLYTMGHQGILDTFYRLYLGGNRVNPIDRFPFLRVCKNFLVLNAQERSQINVPITFVLLPPFEINVKED